MEQKNKFLKKENVPVCLLGNGNIFICSAPRQGPGIGVGDQDSGKMHNCVYQIFTGTKLSLKALTIPLLSCNTDFSKSFWIA